MKLGKILFILFSFTFISLNSQILEPVEWNFDSKKIDENRYELIFTADIDPNSSCVRAVFFFKSCSKYSASFILGTGYINL